VVTKFNDIFFSYQLHQVSVWNWHFEGHQNVGFICMPDVADSSRGLHWRIEVYGWTKLIQQTPTGKLGGGDSNEW